MKKRLQRHLIILIIALLVSFAAMPGIAIAQETDTVGRGERAVYYFSIAKGNITMTPSKVTGYRWNGSSWVNETNFSAASYATYEIGMWTSGDPTLASNNQLRPVTTINGGTVEIVNQTDVASVLSAWDTRASASGTGKRTSTSNTLSICCNVQYQIQLNNVWMTANNCIQFQPHKEGAVLEIYLKGDNRLHNFYYHSYTKKLDSDPDGYSTQCFNAQIQFYDQDKNTGTSKKGTLTLGGTTDTGNWYNSVIGGTDTWDESRGIHIYGGTIFAGAKFSDNCTAIGAGGNGYGSVYIHDGTVTAVCSSTGCAIGGGIGWSSAGGEGYVEISGGTVYAYNHGYGEGSGNGKYVPASAIGGASSHGSNGSTGTVNISGGTVYAESTGGTAIGGGGSSTKDGGDANVTISSSANVTAKSVNGTINGYSLSAGTSIGGGTGSTKGGNVTFKMTGGTLKTGSVGGGKKTSASNAYGSGNVVIEGGTINGQFVLSPPASGHSAFTMRGGTINGKLDGFTYMQPDGYAVWLDDSGGTVTINETVGTSTISGCTGAGNGGAVYMLAGTFTLTAGTIEKCSATTNGGAVYMGGGTFNMNGGTIGGSSDTEGNSASGQGGGIYMGGGSFTMTGGTISYNKTQKNVSNSHGGGIYIASGGTVTIKGGTISNNTANYGGGFYVDPGSSATTTINNANANTTINGNKARYGAGAFIETGSISVSSTNSRTTKIENNIADYSGGGLYVKGSASLTGVLLNNNQANGTDAENRGGGGMFVTGNHDNSISGGEVNNNTAENKGGGVYVNAGANYTLEISGTAKMNSNQANYGGGAYIAAGKLKVTGTNASNVVQIMSNTATTDGGGVYAAAGSVTASNASINSNTATNGNGGGIYAVGAVTVTGGTVSGNHADKNATDCGQGGGIYALAGSNTITVQTSATVGSNTAKQGAGIYAASGSVEVNSSTLSGNVASSDGGGVYAAGGSVTTTTATLSSNSATAGNGGGIYGGGGNITVNAGSIATNTANSGNGGGVYATGGTINFNASSKANPSFTGNTAINGGVLYMEGGTCNINAGTLGGSHANRNKATTSGGAIYVNEGTVNFATGEISFNTAGTSGGGIFVADNGTDYGTLNMTGDVTLSKNHVPAGKHGGGVYLAGVISIGSSTERTVLAQNNFASGTVDTDPGSVTIDATNRNNVYLPNPTVNTGHKDVITVVKNGLTTSTSVGFSVPANFVPVIYCNEDSPYTYLQSFLSGGAMATTVFDDSEKYTTVHISNNSFYDPQHIYLSGGTWVDHVNTYSSAPEGFSVSGNNITISSSEGLAWLIKYINGIAPVTTTPQSGVNVILTADLDMGDYAWVPMGYTQNSTVFTGIFDGQGHTISNLICQYLGTQTGTNLGLFGTVGANAMVKNVQLKDAKVNTSNMDSGTAWLGGIAGQTTGGVIESCVVDAEIETLNSGSVMGGIVGNNGAMVRSCFATADMTGYQMGGLVGANSGDLYNSYAYTKFDHKGGSTYFGGLVGVNTGRVENCYSRVQGTAPTSTYFGWLAGNNTTASDKGLYYCYSPNATYVATASGTTSGNQTGLSTFGVTAANAYDYRVRDNQVSATNDYAPTYDEHHLADYQLKKYLNKWVEQDAAHKATYAGWTRPTTQAINGDYPLLKLHGFNAVAATSGEISLNYGDINTLLTDYATADNSILFYGSKEGMNSNSLSSASLYIDEDAVLTQNGPIQAYVGVTIDNSACHKGANPSFGSPDNIDWHFFSSALTNAQIGLEYDNPNHAYCYWDNPPDPQFTATSQYFPMNLNSYYGDWDLYSYCERDYHWINLKRNSFSHWHEDADWVNIPYTNETVFNPCQGFMVATKEDCYLQAYGTLNNTSPITRPVTCTSGISWTTRQGQNLLGNPYQSYLDFDAFANDANNKTLWSSSVMPFYIIMDEDKADYVTYTKGQTPNEARASRYLHPHQGFMIKINNANAGNAKFDNTMRKVTMDEGWSSTFRGDERPNYALVNLFAKDASGNRDMVTVELGRPEAGGLQKALVPSTSTGRISCYYEDEDYDLAFTELGITEASIRFKTEEDTEYTMTWSTQHGDFSYLHLIDNMTGADIDCLATDEYRFSSRTSDYESRFRLVFGYTGIEEPEEDGPSTGSGTCNFAFMMGGQLVVNGEGTLQMFDGTGRLVSCIKLQGEQNTVSLPTLPAGVYMLRLEGGNGTQTQKIVIR